MSNYALLLDILYNTKFKVTNSHLNKKELASDAQKPVPNQNPI